MATKPVSGTTSQAAGMFTPPSAPAGKAPETQETAKTKAAAASAYAGAVDQKRGDGSNVQISQSAKERAEAQKKAFDIAKGTPDVREDRVKALKARIEAGTYEVDSGKVADGMLREAIMEHLAENEDT